MAASRRHPAVVLLNRAAATARQRDLAPLRFRTRPGALEVVAPPEEEG